MKEVIKLLDRHVTERKIDQHRGLEVLCDFLIDLFDYRHYLTPGGWERNIVRQKQAEPHLFHIYMIWLEKVTEAMERGSWIDFFGGVYEELYKSKWKASNTGQFFTPPGLCDMLAAITTQRNGSRVTANDCACGSGRLLIAQFAADGFPASNYYTAEDIDVMSVKMCALNMMIHGMFGKVVQHDTLLHPYTYDFGFEVNEVRCPFPVPYYSLRRIRFTKEDVLKRNESVRRRYGDNVEVHQYVGYEIVRPKEGAQPKPICESSRTDGKQPYTQLGLFDGDDW